CRGILGRDGTAFGTADGCWGDALCDVQFLACPGVSPEGLERAHHCSHFRFSQLVSDSGTEMGSRLLVRPLHAHRQLPGSMVHLRGGVQSMNTQLPFIIPILVSALAT